MKNFLNNKSQNIYIHIPFCKKKCNYCAFVSYPNAEEYKTNYINSLCEEISAFSSEKKIKTIYIGGGTPNILALREIEQILVALRKNFTFTDDYEFTMEFNPKLSDAAYFSEIQNMGINRISLGVQSFDDNILQTLGRIHNSKEAIIAVENIKNAGINNFSIDLMYGIFSQSMRSLKKDIEIIRAIEPKHISTYGLKIEKGTPFEKYDKRNLPDEDMCSDMYLLIAQELSKNGFEHYEISNFAQKDFESKHNINYWHGGEYFGFGAAAHGYLNGIRYKNSANLNTYISNPLKKEIISKNTIQDKLEEKIFLGLRLSEGINFSDIKAEFGVDLYEKKRDFINDILASGHAQINNNSLSLTNKGFLISNYILAKLLS